MLYAIRVLVLSWVYTVRFSAEFAGSRDNLSVQTQWCESEAESFPLVREFFSNQQCPSRQPLSVESANRIPSFFSAYSPTQTFSFLDNFQSINMI